MEYLEIDINTEFIKLGQLLKLSNIITNGSDFKFFITENTITKNNEYVTERGKKIYKGDVVIIGESHTINVV